MKRVSIDDIAAYARTSAAGRQGIVKTMTKQEALALGAKGIEIREKDLRPESLQFLREGGRPSDALPIWLNVYPGCQPVLNDGRHRVFVAREVGQKTVRAKVVGMGPKGGVIWSYTGKVPI